MVTNTLSQANESDRDNYRSFMQIFGTIRARKTVDISLRLSEALRGRMDWLLWFVFLPFHFRSCDSAGLDLGGDYIISGWFPLHNSDSAVPSTPYLTDCKQ